MKVLQYAVLTLAIATLISCGSSSNKQLANSEGFEKVEKRIKSKFGEGAYYTDLSITYNKSIGNIIGVTVTKDPESLKMGQWNYMQGAWKQISDISLEVPDGSKAKDFMFQLDNEINLSKLGELVEKSSQQLITEKNISKPTLSIASIIFPDNGDISNAEYLVNLQPENGGSTFSFNYRLNGDLTKMDS